MTICLLVITDGRLDYLQRTVTSAAEMLHGDITRRVMYDDTGDEQHRHILRGLYPDFVHVNGGPRQGFGGAIRAAWQHLQSIDGYEYVFHLEQDFTFNRAITLDYLAALLDEEPKLAQVALRRQPWNGAEKEAGGVVELRPDAYQERASRLGCAYLEHSMFFTTNPSLYRRTLMAHGWPEHEHSEGFFTLKLMGAGYRFAYWGARDSGEWVHHIGNQRAGVGY